MAPCEISNPGSRHSSDDFRRQGFDRGRDGGHQILGAKAWNRKLGSEAWKFLRPGDISPWHLGSMDGPLVAEAAEETGNSTES